MDNKALKDILDLQDYIKTLGEDRPKMKVILDGLSIDPQTVMNMVSAAAMNVSITIPPVAVEIVNQLFKLGVTIGFKYAIKEYMEKEFGDESV